MKDSLSHSPIINNIGKTMTEHTTTGNTGNGGVRRMSRWRIAAWVAAALLLLLPLVAGAPWTGGDFVFAGILLFGSLGAYELAARKTGDIVYRAGVGLAIAATFLLIWGNAAMSITDSAADGMYFGVAALGIIGVIIALFRPGGGARAMFAAALALVVTAVVAMVTGMVPNEYVSALEVVGITGFYVALFVGAAWLLREAARSGSERGTA